VPAGTVAVAAGRVAGKVRAGRAVAVGCVCVTTRVGSLGGVATTGTVMIVGIAVGASVGAGVGVGDEHAVNVIAKKKNNNFFISIAFR